MSRKKIKKLVMIRIYEDEEDIINIIDKYKKVFDVKTDNKVVKKLLKLNENK